MFFFHSSLLRNCRCSLCNRTLLCNSRHFFNRFTNSMAGKNKLIFKPDPGSSWEGHSGRVGTGDETVESCGVVLPLRIPLVICPLRRTYVVVVSWTDDLLCGRCKWVSRFEALCVCARWTGERQGPNKGAGAAKLRGGVFGGRHFWWKEGIANGLSRMNLKLGLVLGFRFWLGLDLPYVPVWPGLSRFKRLSQCPVPVSKMSRNCTSVKFSKLTPAL